MMIPMWMLGSFSRQASGANGEQTDGGQAQTPPGVETTAADLDLSASGMMSLVEGWIERLWHYVLEDGPKLLLQAFLIAAIWIAFGMLSRFVGRLVRRGLASPRIRASKLLKEFLVGLVSKAVFVVGLLVILNQVGVEVGPLIAGLGVAGFIAGFALQDVLGNFAAGVMILFYRPFDVGDFVKVGGEMGTVVEMSLVNTVLTTPDNQRLMVPNKKIWGDTIQNVTANPTRRVDLTFGISYADDMDEAVRVLVELAWNHPKVLSDPALVVRVHKLGESSVDIVVRPWVKGSDYWEVYWDLTRGAKETFDRAGISIPFPQRDVHLYSVRAEAAE